MNNHSHDPNSYALAQVKDLVTGNGFLRRREGQEPQFMAALNNRFAVPATIMADGRLIANGMSEELGNPEEEILIHIGTLVRESEGPSYGRSSHSTQSRPTQQQDVQSTSSKPTNQIAETSDQQLAQKIVLSWLAIATVLVMIMVGLS